MNILDKLANGDKIAVVVKTEAELDFVIEYLTTKLKMKKNELFEINVNINVDLHNGVDSKMVLIKDVKIKNISIGRAYTNDYNIIHLTSEIPNSEFPMQYQVTIFAEGSKEEIVDALDLISKDIMNKYPYEISGNEYLDGTAILEKFVSVDLK